MLSAIYRCWKLDDPKINLNVSNNQRTQNYSFDLKCTRFPIIICSETGMNIFVVYESVSRSEVLVIITIVSQMSAVTRDIDLAWWPPHHSSKTHCIFAPDLRCYRLFDWFNNSDTAENCHVFYIQRVILSSPAGYKHCIQYAILFPAIIQTDCSNFKM